MSAALRQESRLTRQLNSAASTDATKSDERLWLQYYDICRQWAGQGTKVPTGQAIFASTSTWRSPVAGTELPKIFSNKGIREVGDTLLDGEAIFYNPSSKGSYFNLVQKWLNHAEGVKQANPEDRAVLDDLTRQLNKASEAYDAASNAASDKFDNLKRPPTKDYSTWVLQYVPAVGVAFATMQATTAAYNQKALEVFGADAVPIQAARAKLLAATIQPEIYGTNMYVTEEWASIKPEKYFADLRAGRTPVIPAPSDLKRYLAPSYTFDTNYASLMDKWAIADPYAKDLHIQTLTTEYSDTLKWSTFGHDDKKPKADISVFGIFSYKTSDSSDWQKTNTDDGSGTINIKMTAKNVRMVTVHAGNWDVPAFDTLYPNSPGVTKPTNAVKPVALLVALGVRLEAQLDGEKKKSFDESWEKVQENRGSFRFFGIEVSLSGENKKEGGETHKANYNKETGSLSFAPTDDAASGSILAVIGQRI